MFSLYGTDALRAASLARRLLAAFCLLAGAAHAGTPHLVLDINQHAGVVSSNPASIGKLGDIALLGAQTPVNGTTSALIRSDGTAAGTYTLHTFEGTGPFTSANAVGGAPLLMTVGSVAYFMANEKTTSNELWVTDGTSAGTHLVKDVTPGTAGDPPRLLAPYKGGVAFTAHDTDFRYQLYITDGTTAGTKQLTGFTASNTGPTTSKLAVAANGKMYFFVQTATCCTLELWVSDGTSAGSHSISALGTDINPLSLESLGNRVLFVGTTQSNGRELYVIDAATDTVSMIDVSAGNDSGVVSDLFPFKGAVYFVGGLHGIDAELWRTDGTPAGTVQITNINPAPSSAFVYPYTGIREVNGHLVFPADDSVHGYQVWSSDGTPGSEVALTSIPTQSNVFLSGSTGRTAFYYTAPWISGAGAPTFYATDGTPAGTHALPQLTSSNTTPLLVNSAAGDATAEYVYFATNSFYPLTISLFRYTPNGSSLLTPVKTATPPSNTGFADLTFLVSNGKLLFNFIDDATGHELWVSDDSGAHLLANLAPEINTDSSFPLSLVPWNGKAVFSAEEPVHGRELWESDGTAAGTHLLVDLVPGDYGANPRNLIVWNGALYFYAMDNFGVEHLLRMATPTSTPEVLARLTPIPLADTFAGPPYCFGATSAVLGNKLYLSASGDAENFEIWATDGTAAGTARVTDINPGAFTRGGIPCDLTVLGNRLYFSADGGAANGGYELWTSDGTASGTTLVKDIAAGPAGSRINGIAVVGNKLMFVPTDANNVAQTWISDGTAAGTRPLFDSAGFAGYPFASANGKSFLISPDPTAPTGDYALWTTDGTAAGTVRVPQVLVDGTASVMAGPTGLYFVNAAETDLEPWITDGTSAGTHRVADLNSSGSSNPTWIANFNGVMLFASHDESGSRIWRSDGTTTGTHLLGPGPTAVQQIEPNPPVIVGQTLLYAGSETVPGIELYAVSNDQPTAVVDSASVTTAQATLNVLSNDADPDGSLAANSVRIVQAPAHGTAASGANGAITYTPTAGYSGSDSFTYTVSDDQGYASNAATVNLTVTAVIAPSPPQTSGEGKKGGGGALGWLEVLALSLIAALRFAYVASRKRHGAVHAH